MHDFCRSLTAKIGAVVASALMLAISATAASAGITYTCDPTINADNPATTCATPNSTIAGLYNSTFNNANANIYIQSGTTALGESTLGFLNLISYNTYRNDLIATASNNAVDTAAVASLPATEPAIFNGGSIEVTSALGAAIGIPNSSLFGTTSGGSACFIGTAGCYNGIITITTPANLSAETGGTQFLYYRMGAQPANAYDFYTVVEHETDEVLGTSSCISTTSGSLTNGCGNSNASAVDLFRYQSLEPGSLAAPHPALISPIMEVRRMGGRGAL
jgi:hypothetical protein